MKRGSIFRQLAAYSAICGFLLLGLCACSINPIVNWDPPKRSGVEPTNLDYGHSYAASLRGAYKREIHKQVGTSTNLNSGLVVAGALALALAASTAHRDALLGTALVGGTAYGLGAMNLPQQRLLILQAGVEAIDCANRAVIPLSMTMGELAKLQTDTESLQTALKPLDEAVASVRLRLSAYNNARGPEDDLISSEAKQLIAVGEEVATASRSTAAAGQLLSVKARQADDQLVAAVDKIDTSILKALLATLPDISSVPKVIAGLAGFSASIAPGAGIDTTIATRLAVRAGEESHAIAGNPALQEPARALRESIDTLRSSIATTRSAKSAVDARVNAYQTATSALETLRDCGVGDISFPLKVSSDKLVFDAGTEASKTFLISGGTRPYVVELADTPAPNVTLKGPAPFESRAQISLSKEQKTAQTFTILVMDASTPTKTASVVAEVRAQADAKADPNSKDKSADKGAAANAITTSPSDVPKLAAALQKKSFTSKDGGGRDITVSVSNAVSEGDQLKISLTCAPAPAPAPLDEKAIVTQLLSNDQLWKNNASGLLLKDKVVVTGEASCVKK